jgi:hypothetical protein
VKTCPACGMPAPACTRSCGYCERPYAAAGPVTYRLTAVADGYRWTVGDDEVATARWRDGTWDVFDLEGTRPALTLVPVDVDGATRVALVDHRSRLVATFAPHTTGGTGIGVIRDGYDRILMLVRGDGPTGTHVIDAEGNVLALAGRASERDRVGLDVLVLAGDGEPVPSSMLVLGVSLLVELFRVGELRRAA